VRSRTVSGNFSVRCLAGAIERTLKKPKAKREHRQIFILFFRGWGGVAWSLTEGSRLHDGYHPALDQHLSRLHEEKLRKRGSSQGTSQRRNT